MFAVWLRSENIKKKIREFLARLKKVHHRAAEQSSRFLESFDLFRTNLIADWAIIDNDVSRNSSAPGVVCTAASSG